MCYRKRFKFEGGWKRWHRLAMKKLVDRVLKLARISGGG